MSHALSTLQESRNLDTASGVQPQGPLLCDCLMAVVCGKESTCRAVETALEQ